jgi:selenocysteine lyase/cysteine desulfurase
LAEKLYTGLKAIPGVKIVGQPFGSVQRSPTISFIKEGKTAFEICTHLAAQNICAWDGHFYAIHAIEVLGLLEKGGVTRMGISAYNTVEEIERVLKVVGEI